MKNLLQLLAIILLLAIPLAGTSVSTVHAAARIQPDTMMSDPLLQFSGGGHIFGFRAVGFYLTDPARPLYIDPTLTWNTFLGGSLDDSGRTIAMDGDGNVYVAGRSGTTWQGATAPRRAYSYGTDAFVAKLDEGGNIIWNTFLGGSDFDSGTGIVVDGSGNVYVTGYSFDTWQGASPPRRAFGGDVDAFTAKLDASGDLVWNTFLGADGADDGEGIAVDASGNVYVTGGSDVTWQGATAPRRAFSGGLDAFAAKLDASGDLVWNTFLGTTSFDWAHGLAVDGSGNLYMTGRSDVTWQGAATPRRAYSGGIDAFAAKLDASGDLVWNTFLGGSSDDLVDGDIAVDGSSNLYVTGQSSATWQGATAPRRAYSGSMDAFAAKLDVSGDLVWNTFLGGSSNDYGHSLAADGGGNIYVSGDSNATWQGTTPPWRVYSGGLDAFAAKLDASGDLVWNTFLGGSDNDIGLGIVVDGESNLYVAGHSRATWQGTTPPQRAYSDGIDAYAAKISPPSSNADLSDLVLSSGTLEPAFTSTTASYTASVDYEVASLTVTPTAADAGASIQVNGTPVASGSASGGISLDVGANTITIIVTAEDGVTTKTYTVVVTRACGGAITVTNANNSGAGSLRQAITDVCAGGTITFDNNYTITLASQLAISKSLTIEGAGHTVAVSGNSAVRVFYVSAGTVTINDLTIQNGRNVPAIPTNIGGAGLFVDTGAAVTLNNCAVLNNATNASPTVGGGIVVNTGASLTMNNCTVSGNSSTFDGGGILNLGTLNVNNSTIVNNSTPGAGGGLETASGTTTLRNTIIAGNSGALGPDCYTPGGTTQSAGYNMVGSTSNCAITPNASDVKGFSYASLLLGSLQNNGGTTPTHALLPGSPAIDAIPAPGCNSAPATDQRGVFRPQNGACDVGAYEFMDSTIPTVDTFTVPSVSNSLAIPIITFTASDDIGVIGYLITTTPTAPAPGASGWSGTAPTIYTVVSEGSYTLYPWAKDAAGNVSSVFATPAAVVVDFTPAVLSIVRVGPETTSAASVDFTVTFSEDVTSVDMTEPFDDFALTTSGVTGAAITSVSGSGSTWTVTVSTGSGSGTLRLDVPEGATIDDLAGKPLGSLPFTGGEVYAVARSMWYLRGQGSFLYGMRTDLPVPADYNGDGKDEIAVFRPSNGTWYLRGIGSFVYGALGDLPVVADYTGDGKADIAVYRPSTSTWYIRGVGSFVYGAAGDIPVIADYTGDGKADIAVFRPSNSSWYIRGVGSFVYGAATDLPVPADYNGDGKADIAVFRPSNHTWYIRGIGSFVYGLTGDIPVATDYNGDGLAEIAVFRRSNSTWYLRGVGPIVYGTAGDFPVPADYTGDGQADIAVFRP